MIHIFAASISKDIIQRRSRKNKTKDQMMPPKTFLPAQTRISHTTNSTTTNYYKLHIIQPRNQSRENLKRHLLLDDSA